MASEAAPEAIRARLAAALARHRDGDLDGAAAAYETVLRTDPAQPDALHLLGLVAQARGETARAVTLIGQAVALAPSARHFANHGLALLQAGRAEDAAAACQAALALRPDYPEALNTLGVASLALLRLPAAEDAHRRAIALRPDYAEAHLNLGNALAALWRYAEAESAFRAAFALRPELNPRAGAVAGQRRRALFVEADGDMPGGVYRCRRMAASARDAGWDGAWVTLARLTETDLHGLEVLVFWRIELDAAVCRHIAFARAGGTCVGLDIDDLIVDPELARLELIDGIRTIGSTEPAVRAHFGRMAQMLEAVDFGTCTTAELARHMRRAQKPVWVIPNGFDRECERAASHAARLRQPGGDGLLRIGYAGGTRTHQRDLAVVARALARVLVARPTSRLVLFRSPTDGIGLVFIEELPELAALADRIEWRDMVPLAALPAELARFDVNIVPLEAGNAFVEAKSELKYFEAALVGVPTIASPIGPYRRAIHDGRTGLLADDAIAWEAALLALLDDPGLRARLAQAARLDALARFGPQARARCLSAMLDQLAADPVAAARAFAGSVPAAVARQADIPAAVTLFAADDGGDSEVCVTLASYNYAGFMAEALDSVAAQTLGDLDLVVVDDGSTDGSAGLALAWAAGHRGRFHRLAVRRTLHNAGLGGNRNVGFAWATAPWMLPLDADNRLLPACAATLLRAAQASGAAFAYPAIRRFGAADALLPAGRFLPQRLVGGNYIDAMALVSRAAWAEAGGYYVQRDAMGWEDYDLWCCLAELGRHGVPVPEVLAEYRVHDTAMSRTMVETAAQKPAIVALLERRHPWLEILARDPRPRV